MEETIQLSNDPLWITETVIPLTPVQIADKIEQWTARPRAALIGLDDTGRAIGEMRGGRNPQVLEESREMNRARKPNPKDTVQKYLFRYRAYGDAYDSLRRILQNNEWYFGSRKNFNDTQDCRVPGVIIDRAHLRRMMAKKDGGRLSKARRSEIEQYLSDPAAEQRTLTAVQQYVDSVGILCLSELPDHPKLWGEYADNGRGVCLMLETLKIAFAPEYIERGPFEIIYSDDPKLAWDPRGSKTFQNAQTEDHLLRKGTKWAYEKEWRFFLHCGEELTVGMHPLPPDALRAVILGPTLTPPERVEIGIWLKPDHSPNTAT